MKSNSFQQTGTRVIGLNLTKIQDWDIANLDLLALLAGSLACSVRNALVNLLLALPASRIIETRGLRPFIRCVPGAPYLHP